MSKHEPPQDTAAEQIMLGTLLAHPEAVDAARQSIKADDFFDKRHAAIFEAVLAVRDAVSVGKPAFPDAVRRRLHEQGMLESVGGVEYLIELAEVNAGPASLDYYVGKITEVAQMRVLLQEVSQTHSDIMASATDPDALDRVRQRLGLSVENAQTQTKADLVCLADVQPESIDWLWPGKIAVGKVTLIAGDPGLGKSLATLDVASRVSTGAGWPDLPGQRFEPSGVVLLSAGDDLRDTIRPRLDAAGADVARVHALETVSRTDPRTGQRKPSSFNLERDLPALEAAIQNTPGCRLVIIDPITAYLGGTDSHNNADVRGLLAPLSALAAKLKVAVVVVTHLNKSAGGSALYRAMGSLAFVAAARTAFVVCKDKNNATGKQRLFLPVKTNISAVQAGLSFEVRGTETGQPNVAWGSEPVTITADDALAVERDTPGPDAEEREEAEGYLRSILADGPRPACEVVEEARQAHGISKRTLERARKELGVEAFREKVPGPWLLRLQHRQGAPNPHCLNKPGDLGGLAGNTVILAVKDTNTAKTSKLFETGVATDLGALCSDDIDDET